MRRNSLIALLLPVLIVGLAQPQVAQEPSLGDVARATRATKEVRVHATRVLTVENARGDNSGETSYRETVAEILERSDFAALEAEANHVRDGKERLPGGLWKLYIFYDTVASPVTGGQPSTKLWAAHIDKLKRWAVAAPASPTPLIALAQAYVDIGFQGRGGGYSDTVSESGWQALGAGASLAKAALREAAALPTKCPHWYFVSEKVALAEGSSIETQNKLLAELINLEPEYYHFYREMAEYLKTKWYGNQGAMETFADQMSARLGGREGQFVYFEIASMAYCECGDQSPHRFDWARIKQGYQALQELYGNSNLKLNRMALMASKFHDKPAASEAFTVIGENWDVTVWRNRQKFSAARAWALN